MGQRWGAALARAKRFGSRLRRHREAGGGALALLVLALNGPASAADAPGRAIVKAPKSPPAIYDWTGWYFGGHVGYSRGTASVGILDPDPTSFNPPLGALYGGVQAGYNHVLPSRVLLGVEADISFPNYLSADDVAWSRTTPQTDIAEKVDFVATLRGRVGYVLGHWMVYATGGFAWMKGRFLQTPGVLDDQDKLLRDHLGWVLGAGTEVAIAPSWTLRLEYLYRDLGYAEVLFPSGASARAALDLHSLRVGLNYKLGGPALAAGAASDASTTAFKDWEVHGQTTYIQQGYPSFRSPYLGENSFTPWAQTRNTWTVGAYLGVRLWQGGELYYNPELLQGFGLHDTSGVAGFPNGEAQKSNFPYPHYNTSRLFLRQTLGFGGEQETLEAGPGQLSGKADVSRLTVQVGKFAVPDLFDGNSYAKDTRKDFMNWSIWAAGAFDYSADKVGLTYGAVAELNQKAWALRAGYFLMPVQSNSNHFDPRIGERGTYVLELETRYSLFSRPGKLRTIAWLNSAFSGSYRETLDNPALDLDIAQTRRGRIKYGYVVNVEQQVADDVGVFGRWSWNDGRTEIMAFTDIDASLSFGASIKGKAWGRPDDTVGIGTAINSLSADHRDFIAAGGLGILIGDGRLNYQQERILETYYAMAVTKALTATFDYQLITNPAYNADRGPVSIFSGRLHAEF
jgi:high affinity Mn2+ porin